MTSNRIKEADTTATVTQPMEGEVPFDLPTVTPEEQASLMPFVAPAASQWRRRLNEAELMTYIRDLGSGRLADDDPQAVMEMLSGIARATTFEEVLGGGETSHGSTLLDVTLAVWGIKFLKSHQPKGAPYFCLLDAKRTDTGEAVLVDVGGWKVLGTMAWCHYAARELPEGSPFLVPKGTPGAIERQTYPYLFKIRKEATASGKTINLLVLPHQ